MPNVLTTQQFDSWPALRSFYRDFFWDTDHLNWRGRNASRTYRRLRAIIAQYQIYREKTSKFTTLREFDDWVNEYAHEVLMVPMNYVDNRVTPILPSHVVIRQVVRDLEINNIFRFLGDSDQEYKGPGYTGRMEVYPGRKKFNPLAWQYGLASHGIFLSRGSWENRDGQFFWEYHFEILDEYHKIEDADDPQYAYSLSDDPDNDDREISDWEDAENRAWEIEEGFADDEIFGDGYAR